MRNIGALVFQSALLEYPQIRRVPRWRGPGTNGHGEVQRCEMAASQVIAEITCRQTENAGRGFHVPTTFFSSTPDVQACFSKRFLAHSICNSGSEQVEHTT